MKKSDTISWLFFVKIMTKSLKFSEKMKKKQKTKTKKKKKGQVLSIWMQNKFVVILAIYYAL